LQIFGKGDRFFKDTLRRLSQIEEKSINTNGKVSDVMKHKAELENILSRHKQEFEVSL
jgi:hypothetical protein